jgi:hypothetical protein
MGKHQLFSLKNKIGWLKEFNPTRTAIIYDF